MEVSPEDEAPGSWRHTEASPGFQREDEAAIPHHSLTSELGKALAAHLWESRVEQLKEDPRREEEKVQLQALGDAGVSLSFIPAFIQNVPAASCSAFNSCRLQHLSRAKVVSRPNSYL